MNNALRRQTWGRKMRLFQKVNGHEFWINFDRSAEVYEIFKSQDGGDYIGCADDLAEVKKVVAHYLAEWV